MNSEFRQKCKTVELLPHSVCPLGFFVFHFNLSVLECWRLWRRVGLKGEKMHFNPVRALARETSANVFFCEYHHSHPKRYYSKPLLHVHLCCVLHASTSMIFFHPSEALGYRNHYWSHFAKGETDVLGGLAPKKELVEWRTEPSHPTPWSLLACYAVSNFYF